MLGFSANVRSSPYCLHGWEETTLWYLKPACKQDKMHWSEISKLFSYYADSNGFT